MKKQLIFLKFFATTLILVLGVVFFGSSKAKAADLTNSVSDPPVNGFECHWIDSAHIICTWYKDSAGFLKDVAVLGQRKNETLCESGAPNIYVCIDFWFAATASKDAKYPVFKGGEGNDKDTDRHLAFTTNDPSAAAWYSRSDKDGYFTYKPPPEGTPTNVKLTKISNAAKSAKPGVCSIFVTSKCEGQRNVGGYDGSNGLDTGLFRQNVMLQAAKEIALSDCNDKAPIGFIFCPLLNGINGAIAALIGGGEIVEGQRSGILVSFLQLPPLLGQNSTFGQVVGNVVTIANIIFVFVFLVLIFSSSLPFGLDNYTIKKTLPKFIAAVILTQFSVVICGVIVDVFNLLGNAIPNVIYFLASGAAAGGNSGQQVVERLGNSVSTGLIGGAVAVGSVIGYILIFIFAFIALIAGLIAIVYMILRYFILYMLVLVAPLAFVAWVIPGTEKFFFNWWKNFIRLNAMYVTIMALLSGSLLLSSLLQSLFPPNDPASLIPSLIPLVALMLIPKTLKWTTQGMAALGSLGAVAGKMNAGVKPAKSVTQKGVKAGRQEAVKFAAGRSPRTAALLAGKNPFGPAGQRLQGAAISEERKNTADQLSSKSRSQVRTSTESAMQGVAGSRNSVKAIGQAQAHIDRLVQTGDIEGVAQAFTTFRNSAQKQGWSNDEIADYWGSKILSTNYGDVKAASPLLTPKSGADLNYISADASGITTTGGDYSGVGVAKLADLEGDILTAHVKSGASASSLGFDQHAVEQALNDSQYQWKNPTTRTQLVALANASGWNTGTSPGGGGAQPPTGGGAPSGGGTQPSPQNPTGGNTTTGTPGNPTVNWGP